MTKLLPFDTETTGLDAVKNGIIQLSGAIIVDGVTKEMFDFKMKPFPQDEIEDEALAVHGMSREEIMTFEDPLSVHKKFVSLLGKYVDKFDRNDKFYPAGYNVRFDIDFLSQWFKKCGDAYLGSWWNWQGIDPLPIFRIMSLVGMIDVPNHKLETMCAYYDIPLKAHDAMSDISATIELVNLVIDKFFKD